MFKKFSYLKKTIIVYAIFNTIIIVAFIAMYWWLQATNIKRNTDSTMEQLTLKATSQFEGILNEMSNISLGIASSHHVYDAMTNIVSGTSKENYFEKHRF